MTAPGTAGGDVDRLAARRALGGSPVDGHAVRVEPARVAEAAGEGDRATLGDRGDRGEDDAGRDVGPRRGEADGAGLPERVGGRDGHGDRAVVAACGRPRPRPGALGDGARARREGDVVTVGVAPGSRRRDGAALGGTRRRGVEGDDRRLVRDVDRREQVDPGGGDVRAARQVRDADAGVAQVLHQVADRAGRGVLAQDGERTGDVRRGHRGAALAVEGVVGDRGVDVAAGREDVEQGPSVAEGGDRVVVDGRADGERGRDAARTADRGGVRVVAGRDDRGDALGEQRVDLHLAGLAVAGGVEVAAAEAHVRRDDVPGGVGGVEGGELVERVDLVGRVRRHARRSAGAVRVVVEAGEDLHRDDVGARGDTGGGSPGDTGPVAGGDAGHVGAVVTDVRHAVEAGGQAVDVGAGVLGRAVGAERLLGGVGRGGGAVLGDDAAAEEGVVDVDPRVEDRDGRPRAGDPTGVDVVGVDDGQAAVEVDRLGDVELHGPDVGSPAQGRDRSAGDLRDEVGGALHRAGDLAGPGDLTGHASARWRPGRR